MSKIPNIHRQVYESMPKDLRKNFYQHYLWQGVSCIRLKPGHMKDFVSVTAESQQHSHTFLAAAAVIVEEATKKNVWACVRFSNNGYQSVLVYLGTRNVDEFLRLSKIRQGQIEDDAGILDENGNPYGDR